MENNMQHTLPPSSVDVPSGESINPLKRKSEAISLEASKSCEDGRDAAELIKDFCPRSYQIKVYEVARKRNTIAVLETGAGKTMIAVMLIQDVYREMKQSGCRKVIVFLAPTVHLVSQQFEVIKSHTGLKVGDYYGAKGVDDWSAECWAKEIGEQDVLVMTPQILLDALQKGFVSIDVMCMLILDECHRTTGNHPYAKIMKEFYHNHKDKPKMFGMTASPVIRKGVSSIADCEGQLSQLERILDSQLVCLEACKKLHQMGGLDDHLLPSVEAPSQDDTIRSEVSVAETSTKRDPNTFVHKILSDKKEAYTVQSTGASVSVDSSISLLHQYCEKLPRDKYYTPKPTFQSSVEDGLFQCELTLPPNAAFHRLIGPVARKSHLSKQLVCLEACKKLHQMGGLDDHLLPFVEAPSQDDTIRSEVSVAETSTKRDPNTLVHKRLSDKKEAYTVQSTGASVSVDSSISLLHQYCEKLPGDKYYTPKPTFQSSMEDGLFQCELTLPPNAAFHRLIGPVARKSHLSKQLVCLEACKKLHQMGGLDDHLLPFVEAPSQDDTIVIQKGSSEAAAGTTKRKELHGTACVHALSGGWVDSIDGSTFYAYRMDFSCSIVDEQFSGFVFLIEAKLDDDVESVQIDLFMHSKKQVKAIVTPCGQLHLDSEQVRKAKRFQEFFFNGIYGKLFTGTKASRKLIFKLAEESLWKSAKMYLLLPTDTATNPCHESLAVNWAWVDSTTNVVEFLKNAYDSSGESEVTSVVTEKVLPELNLSGTDHDDTYFVHFANSLVKIENLKEMVVLATHTGRIYSIVEVLPNMTAESPFDGNDPDTSPNSFADYFKERYGIVLSHPSQPLLLLKQSHNAHNLLIDFNEEGTKDVKVQKPQMHIRMPPELIATVHVPRTVIKSIYLLPSIMHRLESLMLATQLRREIAAHLCNFKVSGSLILEALTTLGCCERFSMERLELLGDSVLKYAVSCNVFLKYPKKHEGQLTAQRQIAIGNATLHKFGTQKKLQGYIRACPFDPRRWLAPGQYSVCEVPCSCGVDTEEVPLESKFVTIDPKIKVGVACDLGHRWLGSKTIADCVEALIGAYYVSGGLPAALYLMNWLGVDADIDHSFVLETIASASLHSYIPEPDNIKNLESKLGYEFSVKSLLLEAVTHASEQEVGVSYCFQRLEFLGDSVLDLLITWHLYNSHEDVDPGELTDLRSASVSNQNFAQVAVRHQLYQHLQHCSGVLLNQIDEYVKYLSLAGKSSNAHHDKIGPKALGDLVESIAGAILFDTKLNLDEVWRIFKPLLSPIVTPDNLQLQPHRELVELCDSLGYFVNEFCTRKGEVVHAELRLQLKDVLIVRQGSGINRKTARGQAAFNILKDLEKQDIFYSRFSSKSGSNITDGVAPMDQDVEHETANCQSTSEILLPAETEKGGENTASSIPVIESIDMKKGGPRSSLFQLCRKLQLPMPSFGTTETKSRTPMSFGEGPNKREGFNSYASEITLHIPNCGDIVVMGEARADKKSSYDSAALLMLHKLEQIGQLIIGGTSVP